MATLTQCEHFGSNHHDSLRLELRPEAPQQHQSLYQLHSEQGRMDLYKYLYQLLHRVTSRDTLSLLKDEQQILRRRPSDSADGTDGPI